MSFHLFQFQLLSGCIASLQAVFFLTWASSTVSTTTVTSETSFSLTCYLTKQRVFWWNIHLFVLVSCLVKAELPEIKAIKKIIYGQKTPSLETQCGSARRGKAAAKVFKNGWDHESFECLSLIGHKNIFWVQSTPGLQGWKTTFFKIVPLKTTTPPSFVQYKFLSFDLFVGGKNNKSCQEPITLPLPINQL